MNEGYRGSPSLAARLVRDPVALRRRCRVAALAVGLAGAVAGSGWLLSSAASSGLMALSWLFAPLVAVGIGIGDAFFLRHGIGQRRVLLTLLLSVLAGLVSCAVLAGIAGDDSSSALLSGVLYFVLILAVISGLASMIGIGVGRGEGYLSRKVQDVDDTGW